MRLSVAMTAYNGAQYVEAQLRSLLSQTRQADEVMIVDDGSEDGTDRLITVFLERHRLNWHFEKNEANLGYKANFKKAISQTTGDIIFLCDQDDIWYPEKLAEMEQVFSAHPECQALNTSFVYIDGQDAPIGVNPLPGMSNQNLIKRPIPYDTLEKMKLDEIVSYNITPGCTMAFRTKTKQIYQAHTACGVVHDWEINLIAALQDGCYFWNRPLIRYRIHGKNAVGIPGVGQSSKIDRGSYQYRLAVAKQMKVYTDCFAVYLDTADTAQKSVLKEQIAFVTARYQALESKRICKILSLYKAGRNYRNSVTRKGRIADFLCILKEKMGRAK